MEATEPCSHESDIERGRGLSAVGGGRPPDDSPAADEGVISTPALTVGPNAALDEKDAGILTERQAAYDAVDGPRVGDYVRFADETERRVSYVWKGDGFDSIQTSDGGSWYLGDGYASFSGSLHPGVPSAALTLTDETKPGRFWFFHHDIRRAHNDVDVELPCRVYAANAEAP